jgi:glycosyltransferase involved in cell wall biosynthesis
VFDSRRPRILQVGTRPNKNLEGVIRAVSTQNCTLHIIGELSEAQRSLLVASGVDYENQVEVDDAAIRQSYEQADLIAFVSLAEGFGLPIIEANALGRPVITSDLPPMRDIAARAACLVDPLSVEQIRLGIRRIIFDEPYRNELIREGYRNATRFSPSTIARQFADLYAEVISDSTPRLHRETRAWFRHSALGLRKISTS